MREHDCNCVERFRINEKDVTDKVRYPYPQFGKYHSCRYVSWRNSKIPQAEQIATMRTPYVEDDTGYGYKWTRNFVRAMEELCQ